MHYILDAALKRGHLEPNQAQSLQARLEAGAPLPELLREAGLSPAEIDSLAQELQAAAQGVTTPLPPRGSASPSGADPKTAWDSGFVPRGQTEAAYSPGDRIGDFELIELLGQGGMGAVYRARELGLEREVALKLVSPAIARDPEARQRFLREARSAAAVNHPNVITILRVDDGEVLFMALELLPGGDADDLRRAAGGRLSERRALEIGRDCARGLSAIDARNLVHRDLKPANVFLSADGAAKLADLGLARTQSGDDRMTQTGMIVGTPAFMSPEQADGDEVDIRSDVYALGATLFQLVTGRPPFEGKSPLSVVAKVLTAPTPDPRDLVPELSATTGALIRKAMAKERAERFQTPAELASALEGALALLEGEGACAGAVAPAGPALPTPAKPRRASQTARAEGDIGAARASAPAAAEPAEPADRGRMIAIALVTVVALVAMVLVFVRARERRRDQAALAQRAHSDLPRPLPSPQVTAAPPAATPSRAATPRRAATPAATPSPTLRPLAELLREGTLRRPPASGAGASAWDVLSQLPTTGADEGRVWVVEGAGSEEEVTWGFQPGDLDWGRATVYGGPRPHPLPCRVAFVLHDLEVQADDPSEGEACPLSGQGLATHPAGLFLELGLKTSPNATTSGSELEGGTIWLTLQLGRDGRATATLRRLNDSKVSRAPESIDLGQPGVERLLQREFRWRGGEPLAVVLDLSVAGWSLEVTSASAKVKRQSGTWEAGTAPFGPELQRGFFPWLNVGNWGQGRGRARVEFQPLDPDEEPALDPSDRQRRAKRRGGRLRSPRGY